MPASPALQTSSLPVEPLPVMPLRQALDGLLQAGDELRYLHHLHAVLLVALGQAPGQVAQWLGCSPRSVERWVRSYRHGGCAWLGVTHGTGRPARLGAVAWTQLCTELAAPPLDQGFHQTRWCGKLLATHLERRYGLQLGIRQCQRLLTRIHPC